MSRIVALITVIAMLACGGLTPKLGSVGPPWSSMNIPTAGAEVVLSTSISLTLNYPNKTLPEVHAQWVEEANSRGWKTLLSDVNPDTTTVLFTDGSDNYMLVIFAQPAGVMVTLGLDKGGGSGVDPALVKALATETTAGDKSSSTPKQPAHEDKSDEAAGTETEDTDDDKTATTATDNSK